MGDFTRKQKDIVDRAFVQLESICTAHTHRMEYRFGEAYKKDRRERSAAFYAKAHLCEAFLDGWHGKASLADLDSYADGPQQLVIIGASIRKDHSESVTQDQINLLVMAKEAYEESIRTRLENI